MKTLQDAIGKYRHICLKQRVCFPEGSVGVGVGVRRPTPCIYLLGCMLRMVSGAAAKTTPAEVVNIACL